MGALLLLTLGLVGCVESRGEEGATFPAASPPTPPPLPSATHTPEPTPTPTLEPTPTPEPTPAPKQETVTVGSYSREEMRSVLEVAGWPEDWREGGVALACGPAVIHASGVPVPTGESGCDPGETGRAGEIGLFQMMPGWADWCGVNPQDLYLPLVNARCALEVMRNNEALGMDRYRYWSLRPLLP